MAKAALNMLTRTSSEDLAKSHRIFMNSVDTGTWCKKSCILLLLLVPILLVCRKIGQGPDDGKNLTIPFCSIN